MASQVPLVNIFLILQFRVVSVSTPGLRFIFLNSKNTRMLLHNLLQCVDSLVFRMSILPEVITYSEIWVRFCFGGFFFVPTAALLMHYAFGLV